MTHESQSKLDACDRLLAAQLAAAEEEPKVPLRQQIRELQDPENHMHPLVRRSELARLTGKAVSSGRGRPAKMAAGDYGCENVNINIDDELDHFRYKNATATFGHKTKDDTPSSKKRMRPDDEEDLFEDTPPPPLFKKQMITQQPSDGIADIDFAAMARELNEEDSDEEEQNFSQPPKKRKRVADDDGLLQGSSASPATKRQATGRQRKMTKYCGVHSPSLNDPPLQPKKGGFQAASTLEYHCSRCDIALSRTDSVRKHFEKCIELNGNPEALSWTNYRVSNREPEKIVEALKHGGKGKSANKTFLPTPASSPEQVPATIPTVTPAISTLLSSSPAQQATPHQPKGHKQTTPVCGRYSPAINEPPIQPPGYGSNQTKNRYHCPRCHYALSVADSVRKHFASCIDRNGNPESLSWTDYYLDSPRPMTEAPLKEHSGPMSLTAAAIKHEDLDEETDGEDHYSSRKPAVENPMKGTSGPISLATAALKRKHRDEEDGDENQRDDLQQKRQKRTYKKTLAASIKTEQDRTSQAANPHAAKRGLFPTTNPHPYFERTMQPWDRPAPGWLSEIDMCTWQKREGNTIPLSAELALMRGEIMSIKEYVNPEAEEEKKKKLEEQMARQKKREQDEAFFAQFPDEE